MGGDEAMIVAGIGCRSLCPAGDIVAVLRDAEMRSGVRATALAAPHFKHAEPGLHAAALLLGLDLHWIGDDAMTAMQPACPTRSATVLAATGHQSIAEAACLAAAGPGAILVLPRIAHARATCALAESLTA